MKPKIIHFIDYFSKGGAEVLLAGIVPHLDEYEHYIFYLTETEHPINNLLPSHISIECFQYAGLKNIIPTLSLIRRRLKEINPDIIHSHLLFATLFSRLLLPKKTKLITTYHNAYYHIHYSTKSARIKRSILKFLDKITYKPGFFTIHVSAYQQKLNDRDTGISSSHVLYNYIEDAFFNIAIPVYNPEKNNLHIVSVGNLKTEKNHILILQAMRKLKHLPISLHIYGEGRDRKMLQQYIDDHALSAVLKGNVYHLDQILPAYDLFILASTIEGFGISAAESMAAGLPALLSDIDTFKEITDNKALFFQNNNSDDLAAQIEKVYQNPSFMQISAEDCKQVAVRYKKETYLKKLLKIYADVLKS